MRKWVLKTALAAVAILALSASGAALDEAEIKINATVVPYAVLAIPDDEVDLKFTVSPAVSTSGYEYRASTTVWASIATNTPVYLEITRKGDLPSTVTYSAWKTPLFPRLDPLPVPITTWSGDVELNGRFTVDQLHDFAAGEYTEMLYVTVSAQ